MTGLPSRALNVRQRDALVRMNEMIANVDDIPMREVNLLMRELLEAFNVPTSQHLWGTLTAIEDWDEVLWPPPRS